MNTLSPFDIECLEAAVNAARDTYDAGNYPVGAVLAVDNEMIDVGGNEFNLGKEAQRSFVNHAENLLIINRGAVLSDAYRDKKVISLYSTLEPCIQCLGAAVTNHVKRIVYIQKDPNGGACNLRHDNIGLWYKEFWPEIIYCDGFSDEPKQLMIKFFHEEIERGNKEWPQKMLRLLESEQ